MKNIFNFSGGKTSAYMVIHYWKPGDLVIFTDTGREHPKTYKFIHDFEAFENIPVIKISYKDSDNPFDEMLAKRKHKQLPNRMKRICTVELKIRTCKRYLKSIGIIRFNNIIGFRYDEELRVKRHVEKYKKVKTIFPLYENKIDKAIINNFWNKKNYNLEIPSILGNCTLCFMKGKNAIINILSTYPELAKEWIKDEEIAQQHGKHGGHTYFPDITYKQLLSIAQNNLFKDIDLNNISSAYNCSCTP